MKINMEALYSKKLLIYYVFLVALGFILAILSFEYRLFIKYPRDMFFIKYSIFPFTQIRELPSPYFHHFYTPATNAPSQKIYIGSVSMFPSFPSGTFTQGGDYINAIKVINEIDDRFNPSMEQKDCIASNFYYLVLDKANLGDARQYVNEIAKRFETESVGDLDLSISKEILKK